MYGVQGYPTVRIFPPGAERNPYTGKVIKLGADYQGPRSARGMVDAATKAIPSHVVAVDTKNSGEFLQNGTLPKALLFTNKVRASSDLPSPPRARGAPSRAASRVVASGPRTSPSFARRRRRVRCSNLSRSRSTGG